MNTWNISEAKRRFSEIIERAQTEGPQVFTRYGKDRAVVLAVEDYRKLDAARPDFKEYLLSGPSVDDFENSRSDDPGREVEL